MSPVLNALDRLESTLGMLMALILYLFMFALGIVLVSLPGIAFVWVTATFFGAPWCPA